MKIFRKIAVATTSLALGLTAVVKAMPASAVTFNEVGDTGQTLSTAQTVGEGSDQISGTISSSTDVDLYKLSLPSGSFSASTQGGSSFDTELYLFDSIGKGIVFNDDVTGFSAPSFIQATLAAGDYYLAITGWDNAPISSGGKIFPDNSFIGSAVNNGLQGPNGPGGSGILTSWVEGQTNQNGGPYTIFLSPSTSMSQPATSVPEPITVIGTVIGGIVALRMRKKLRAD